MWCLFTYSVVNLEGQPYTCLLLKLSLGYGCAFVSCSCHYIQNDFLPSPNSTLLSQIVQNLHFAAIIIIVIKLIMKLTISSLWNAPSILSL